MMTKEFEPITEVGIHQDDFGEGTVSPHRLHQFLTNSRSLLVGVKSFF